MIFDFKNLSAYGQALKTTSTDIGELSKLTSNLTLAQTVNALSTKNLTTQEMAKILVNKGLTQAEAEATAAKIASAKANGVATFSLKAYTVALWENVKAIGAWMLTNPVGWIIGLGIAIGGAVIAYDLFNESIEEQKKKLKELENEYQSAKDKLLSLNTELKNNIKLIKELQAKKEGGTITLVEEDQLEKLKFQNSLLSQQIKLEEDLTKKTSAKLVKENRETFYNEFGGSLEESDKEDTFTEQNYEARASLVQELTDKRLILLAKENEKRIAQAVKDNDTELIKSLEENKIGIVEELNNRSDTILLTLLEYQNNIAESMNPDGTFASELDEELWNNIEDWKKYIYKYSNRSGEWNTIQIDAALNTESLQAIQTELQQKLADGTLTEKDIEGYTELNKALKDSNLILTKGQDPLSIYMTYLQKTSFEQTELNEAIESLPDLSFDEILEQLEESHTTLTSLKKEVDEYKIISVDTIQDLMTKYPTLTNLLSDYVEGKAEEKDIIDALADEYATDLENYRLYIIQKHGDDEEFYDKVVDNLSEDLIAKADFYGIELINYSNYLEARLAMDKEHARKKAALEGAEREYKSTINDRTHNLNPSLSAYDNITESEKDLEDYEKFLNEFDASIDTIIPNFNTSLFNQDDKGDNNKFSEDYDWFARSVENANRRIEELDNTLSNTEGFTERLAVLEQLKKANEDLVTATAEASEEYKNIWETESAKIDSKYVKLITSSDRSQLTIENFDSEEEYNKVMKLIDLYDRWQDSIVQNNDAVEKLKANEDETNSILLEREELNLENHNLVNQESMTVAEKNKWLDEEKRIKGEILKLNLALATTEEERLKLQKIYDEYIAAEPDKKYENGRESRANKTSYYNSRIQDIQNDIALEEARGGQGTKQQYLDMNALHEKNKAIYQADYKTALAKRNGEKWGTAAYKEYNDQVQEAQDNINECTIAQIENNRAILLLPIKQYEDLNKELEEDLEYQTKLQSKIESAIGYATILVQDEIDALNERKQTISDGYDDQIKAIQEQKDALTESNDEIQRQIDLENAKYNLEKAIRNKITRIYRAGQGFVYEADQDAIRDAQQELDQQQFDNTIADFDKQIDTLNEDKEDDLELIDEEIKSWEEYANKLNAVSDSYERLISKRAFLELFKASGESSILQQDEGILTVLETSLNSAKSEVDLIQEKIDANNTTMQKIREEAEAYLLKQLEIKAAQDEINKAIVENQEELDAIQDRTDETEELSNEWTETDANITSALEFVTLAHTSAKESEALILDERKAKLEEFKNAAVSIYSEIASQINKANSAFSSLETILANAKNTYNQILEYQAKAASAKAEGNNNGSNNNGTKGNTTTSKGKSGTIIQKYHSGGIVGKSKNNLPDNFVALTEANLQPNETLAKLLFGEVVLNTNQMGNMVDNLNRTYSSILPATLNKRENTSNTTINIGDVNVYNPDNSDMIVNEIVKELPLKVIQRLNSK